MNSMGCARSGQLFTFSSRISEVFFGFFWITSACMCSSLISLLGRFHVFAVIEDNRYYICVLWL